MPGKTAFLFPGQGTVPEVLPPSSPLVDRLLAQAAAAGIDLEELIQDRQRIALTEFAQPA
ncbi:malonyl CoA-acyl carrier protein transacylase, partial [Candidatus Acetothermia bacterium]